MLLKMAHYRDVLSSMLWKKFHWMPRGKIAILKEN
jgi:hypothetical protein